MKEQIEKLIERKQASINAQKNMADKMHNKGYFEEQRYFEGLAQANEYILNDLEELLKNL